MMSIKRFFKRASAVFAAFCMACLFCFTAFAEDAPAQPFEVTGDYTGYTVIIHTNDVHGFIQDYAKVAALKKDFENAGAYVYVVDAGDFSQGNSYVSLSKGASAVKMMNLVGYDVVTMGNHEFDYGYDNLKQIMEEAEFAPISVNILHDGEPMFAGSTTVTTPDGLKIGFFGVETPESATKTSPAMVRDMTFLSGDDMMRAAQAEIDSLRQEGCALVIGVTHLGILDVSWPNRSIDLWENVTNADMLIDGHSHTVMTSGPDGEPIQSTGISFDNIGVIIISPEGKIVDNYLVDTDLYLKEDAIVTAAADEIISQIEALYGETFAVSEVFLAGERTDVRVHETNLGNLVTDAMRWFMTKDGTDELGIPAENILAIMNGGGISNSVQAGPVTMNDITSALPYGNTVCFVKVPGSVLLETLETATFATPEQAGSYPQTSGILFTVNTDIAFDPGEIYPESEYHSPASIQRVTIESINGRPFDENAVYGVVTNDFIAAGGGAYYAFSISDVSDTGMPLDEAVIAYISEVLEGVVSAEDYAPVEW